MSRYSKSFWNRTARKYAKSPVADEAAYEVKLAKTAAIMTPEMVVLEYGCGTGTTALKHASRVARIDAIDVADEMIAIAKEKAGNTENVQFSVSAIEEWTPPTEGYDMVMAHSILHLVEHLPSTLKETRSMLKPGGYFVSSTVCLSDISRLLGTFVPVLGRTGIIPQVTPLTATKLVDQIAGAGFEIAEVWRPPSGKAIFVIARAI